MTKDSYRRAPLNLPGGTVPQPAHKFKDCAKCSTSRPPEGGIEMKPGRWVCASCWSRITQSHVAKNKR
jgi:hypothetical protein